MANEQIAVEVADLTTTQRAEWLRTGEIPKVKPQTEAPASSPAPGEAQSATEEVETAPEPETGKPQVRRKPSAEETIKQLKARVKELEGKAQPPAPDAKTAEPSTAKPEAKELEAPKKPVLGDFRTYEEYEAARDDYFDKLSDYKAKKALLDYQQEQKKATEKAEAEKHQKAQQETLKKRYDAALKKYPDLNETVFSKEFMGKVPAGSVLDGLFLHREASLDVARYLYDHPDEFTALLTANPLDVPFEFARIESALSPSKEKPPARQVTKAPAPPSELGGRNTAPDDDVDLALKNGDSRAYIDRMNARDLKKARKA